MKWQWRVIKRTNKNDTIWFVRFWHLEGRVRFSRQEGAFRFVVFDTTKPDTSEPLLEGISKSAGGAMHAVEKYMERADKALRKNPFRRDEYPDWVLEKIEPHGFSADDFDLDGIYKYKGKYEREHIATIYYWCAGLDGEADIDIDSIFAFKVGKQEREAFGFEKATAYYAVDEDANGFVTGEEMTHFQAHNYFPDYIDPPPRKPASVGKRKRRYIDPGSSGGLVSE